MQPTSFEVDFDRKSILLAWADEFDTSIVGERSYQDEIEKIAGGRDWESAELEVVAMLAPCTHPKDPCAIAIVIQGMIVGYVPRDQCSAYRREMKSLSSDNPPFACRALVVGGWDRDGDQGYFGVKLSVARPFAVASD